MSANRRRKFGPPVVLAVAALIVVWLSAFATAHDWLEFATGRVYTVTAATEPHPTSSSATPSTAPGSDTGPEGYDAGYRVGKQAGFKRGLKKGRSLGYKHGFEIGHRKGYKTGDASGYQAGHPVGMKAGHQAGVKKLESQLAAWKAAKGGTGG